MVVPLPMLGDVSMEKDDDKSVLDVLRDVMEGEASRRSRLDRWMTSNYEEFSSLLEGQRPNWPKLTEVFDAMGFGELGKPLDPEAVRLTWFRVRKRKTGGGKRSRRMPHPMEKASDVVTEVVREPVEDRPVPGLASGQRPRVSPVRPVTPVTPALPPGEASGAIAEEAPEDARPDRDAVLRALNDQFNTGRGRMPDPIK